jgi:hypothetical protein
LDFKQKENKIECKIQNVCFFEILKEEKINELSDKNEIENESNKYPIYMMEKIDKKEEEINDEKSDSESISASEEKDDFKYTV